MIPIEVAYALPERQVVIPLIVTPDCTIEKAIIQSGMLALFPEIDLLSIKVGIFGQQVPLSHLINAGDRIEIYRPLKIDPKKARLLRQQNLL